MGNHPSSTAPTPASEQDSASSHDAGASRPSRQPEPKNIAAMHASQRAAAPAARASPPQPDEPPAPSKPVAVPIEPASARSHHSAEPPSLLSQNSVTDMSYLTRPPRLPLPIEEELHTPGSPIIAPTDAGELADVEALDSDMTRKSSALSGGTSADDDEEDDGEGLVVDRTRPTVPTTLRWLRGGEKVYVTGTIFQWNRKHRLQPA